MGNYRMLISLLALTAGFTSGMVACTKDQDLDAYNQTQYENENAKNQAAAGTYSGVLISNLNHSALGAMKISIEAGAETVIPTNGQKSSLQPVLHSTVEILSQVDMQIDSSNSTYDPDSGIFEADIPLAGGGISTTARIQGKIIGDSFVGTIAADGYDRFGGSFSLSKKNNPSVQAIAAQNPSVADNFITKLNYAGTITFSNVKEIGVYPAETTVTRAVNLVLLRTVLTSQAGLVTQAAQAQIDMLTLLVPTKPVTAQLNFSESLGFLFDGATLDVQANQLKGVKSVTASAIGGSTAGQISMTCSLNSESGYDCNLTTTGASVATITTRPVAADAPTAPNEGAQSALTGVNNRYFGKGLMVLPTDPPGFAGRPINAVLTALYPARTLEQDITTLLFPQGEWNLNLTLIIYGPNPLTGKIAELAEAPLSAIWEQLESRFNSTSTITDPQSSVQAIANVAMNCVNFTFADTNNAHNPQYNQYDFQCDYSSTLNGLHGTINFNPSYTTTQTRH